MSLSAWGTEKTKFFYSLTPEEVMNAVESSGYQCTGRCFALNSMENRVYEIEVESDDTDTSSKGKFCVVKFYRPGRWTHEQILEEHEFLLDLKEYEIPVVAPLQFSDGSTLKKCPTSGMWYAVFPRVGGRAPEELTDEQVQRIGRLLGRIHNVGATKKAEHRISLTPVSYGLDNLDFLLKENVIPLDLKSMFEDSVREICRLSSPWFEQTPIQRIHGDCHLGNLLWNQEGPFFLDFDDMLMGPCVQDLWLVVPGRDPEAKQQFQILVEAYRQMRTLESQSLRLVEPLRALRFVHFITWMTKRWEDPAFPRAFPYYGTYEYWGRETQNLKEQLSLIQQEAHLYV